VDALCILQDAMPEERSKQIDNMDSIYANAYFTIVAADSASARQGIHGVSIRRTPPESFRFYVVKKDSVECSRANIGISSAEVLAHSTRWATRAWTYQEVFLSRRLLVFTEELCFLICPGGVRREDMIPEDDTKKLRDQNRLYFFRQDNPHLKSPSALYDAITVFSTRDLTLPNDILKAFGGTLTAMKERHGEMRYGMPLRDLNFALSWKHHDVDLKSTASIRLNFGCVVQPPSGQREGFPTWSWAGWLHDGAKVYFPGRKLGAKAVIHYISDAGTLETTSRSSEPDEPPSEGNSSEILSYLLADDEKQYAWHILTDFDLPLDSLLILKTLVLRICIDHMPTEISGDWGIYVHNFDKGKQPVHNKASPLDDPYRSTIHVSRDWMDSQGGELEFAVLGADTSDPKTLHLETIVIDRSGSLCYRVSATDLRFKVAEGSSTEETLARIVKENAVEILILG
jgi:hypothetical protein